MKDGFIKVAAVSPEIRVADCVYNTEQILAAMQEAELAGVKLLVLPELCVTGYTCGDLFLQNTLLAGAKEAVLSLMQASEAYNMLVLAGAPLVKDGKLYNCAVVIYHGKLLGVVPKTYLPNYSEFYEQRHFTAAPEENSAITVGWVDCPFGTKLLFSCENMPNFTFAAELCEDVWVPNPPSVSHACAGATVIANLSASDEIIAKEDYRRDLVTGQSARLVCGYIYADAGEGESTTDMVFAAHNLIAENGSLLAEKKPFRGGMIVSEIDVDFLAYERRRLTTFHHANKGDYLIIGFRLEPAHTELSRYYATTPFVPSNEADRAQRCEMILSMQSAGLKKRVKHIGCDSVVVGISGGLDSCLALLVAVRAMDALGRDRKEIIAVTMPCFGTTERTKNNAQKLCEILGVDFRTIDITAAVLKHFEDIGHPKDKHDVTYENAQARERTQVLMDIANQTNGIVIGTGDLSESALGWATYNGDHMSMYGVNASVPKTLVRHIVRYAAEIAESSQEREVLLDILDTPVSPELLPADNGTISQKTEELVGPYELHDFFLYHVVRRAFPPKKVYRLACYAFNEVYDSETILSWLKVFYKRFFAMQFKRSCMPDGPKIGSVTLSPRADWRMPSDASSALWLKDLDEL